MKELYIISPDMLPMTFVFGTILLFGLCILAIWLIVSWIRCRKLNNAKLKCTFGLTVAFLLLFYVIVNISHYINYYKSVEEEIVGEYQSINGLHTLLVNSDKTWKISNPPNGTCNSGYWELVISEDFVCWNMKSFDEFCIIQTNKDTINFEIDDLIFIRKAD